MGQHAHMPKTGLWASKQARTRWGSVVWRISKLTSSLGHGLITVPNIPNTTTHMQTHMGLNALCGPLINNANNKGAFFKQCTTWRLILGLTAVLRHRVPALTHGFADGDHIGHHRRCFKGPEVAAHPPKSTLHLSSPSGQAGRQAGRQARDARV